MKYWTKESRKRVITTEDITKDNVLKSLAYIKHGYLPDWNYETSKDISLPNEYYPLHVAMQVAIKAIEAQDDGFFKHLNAEYTQLQESLKL